MSQMQGVMRGPSQADVDSFKMPEIQQGITVKWYRNGEIDGNPPLLAFVERATNRAVVVRLSDGRRYETVRHVNDPKLKLGASQRENGAWDYSDDYLETKRFRETVLKRLSSLEEKFAKLIGSTVSAANASELADRVEDFERRLDIFSKQPNAAALVERLEAVEAHVAKAQKKDGKA